MKCYLIIIGQAVGSVKYHVYRLIAEKKHAEYTDTKDKASSPVIVNTQKPENIFWPKYFLEFLCQ